MITIYGDEASPPTNKVRFVANALGLAYEFKAVNLLAGEHKTESFLKLHPAGKVPVVKDGDFVLFESNAIIRYLADREASKLYPKELRRRAVVDQWLDFASLHISMAVERVVFNRVVYKFVNMELDERSLHEGLSLLQGLLPIVESQLAKHPYLTGSETSLADFCLLTHLDPAEIASIDLSPYSHLQRWRDGLRAKDFYQKCFPSYTQMLHELMGKLGK